MGRHRRSRGQVFTYEAYELEADGVLSCHYSLDDDRFTERFAFDPTGADYTSSAAQAAARLLFLLAGVSYYKTSAPPLISGPADGLTSRETSFLLDYYLSGLAEFSYQRSGVDISGLSIDATPREPAGVEAKARKGSPLVPFGGGIDSVVVAQRAKIDYSDVELFVANTTDIPFAPIEATAAVTGLPIRRMRRYLDPKVLASAELGYYNGHVPVTGILSAAAVLCAVANGHDRVIMSNEHSASDPTSLRANGVFVNHQWSKGLDFERGFRELLDEAIGNVGFFSALRPYSELWVAREFASLRDFHSAFHSCNKAFYIDEESRLTTWCGRCDKCCFINLILAPYLSAAELDEIFRGNEPLQNEDLEGVFRSLLGQPGLDKPLECVGDERECRTALALAAARPDRTGNRLLAALMSYVADSGKPVPDEDAMLRMQGTHFIPADSRR